MRTRRRRRERHVDGADGRAVLGEDAVDEDAAQEDVYEVAARERVAGVLDGYNATLLAYGQTGSGKTHTMYGPPEVLASFEGAAYDDYGLVPRACEQIFEAIDAADVEARTMEHRMQCGNTIQCGTNRGGRRGS